MLKIKPMTRVEAVGLRDEALALMCEALTAEYGMSASDRASHKEAAHLMVTASQMLTMAIDLLADVPEKYDDDRFVRFQCAVAEYHSARSLRGPAADTVAQLDQFLERLGSDMPAGPADATHPHTRWSK